jgi:hypothetical protein
MARDRQTTGTAPARSDAYTGLLVISLIAQFLAVLFLYLDWNQYPDKAPKDPPSITVPSAPAAK